MQSTIKLALEALKFTDGITPHFFHPTKQQHATQPHEIEKILPQSPDGESRTLDVLTSDSYARVVKKLAHYLNIPLEQVYDRFPNLYAFNAVVMGALQSVMQIEAAHKERLEMLAVEAVLDLPEFSLFREPYEQGILNLDVAIGPGELGDAKTLDSIEDELETNQETVIDELVPQLQENEERKLKRAFHNFITQGNALHKSFLFNNINEELVKIDPTLPEKYGLIMACVHVLYYNTPYMSGDMLKGAGMGSSQMMGNDEVKIRGIIFPVLVHEIVKGLFEFLGQDISPDSHGNETLEDEYMQLMTGPAIYNKLNALIPNDKMKYFPVIYRGLMKKSAADIREIMSGSPRGRSIIGAIIIDAEREATAKPAEEDDEPMNFDFSIDDGEDEDSGESWKKL